MSEIYIEVSVGVDAEDVTEEFISAELVIPARRLELYSSHSSIAQMSEQLFVEELTRALNEAKLFSDKLLIPLIFDANELLESVEGNLYLEKQIKLFAKEILK